jgi:hypothetical protein
MKRYSYKYPQQLVFGHLNAGEFFSFSGDNVVYQKLTTWMYVEVEARVIGQKIIAKIKTNASAKRAKSLQLPVTDCMNSLFP